jgi:ubiquinol-cytochrome c reductase cytochrome b subunit
MSFWGAFIVASNAIILYPYLNLMFKKFHSYSSLSPNAKIRADKRIGPHPEYILSIIYGTLLGDSHLEKRNNNVRISFQQENSNMEYLMWLWKTLSDAGYCSVNKPVLLRRIGVHNKIRYFYRINTWTFSSWNYLYGEWYWDNSGKKRVPKDIYNHLTPLALACWVMDDGAKVGAGFKFCTNGFMKEDVELLAHVLKSRYELETSVQSAGSLDQWIIYIKVGSMPLLRDIVGNHIVPSMRYKIN